MGIQIKSLTDEHKGRHVAYTSQCGNKIEFGHITSWNEKFIFVKYYLQVKPHEMRRSGSTSEATSPADLEFLEYPQK